MTTAQRSQWLYLAGLCVAILGLAFSVAAIVAADGWGLKLGALVLAVVALGAALVCWNEHLYLRREALRRRT